MYCALSELVIWVTWQKAAPFTDVLRSFRAYKAVRSTHFVTLDFNPGKKCRVGVSAVGTAHFKKLDAICFWQKKL